MTSGRRRAPGLALLPLLAALQGCASPDPAPSALLTEVAAPPGFPPGPLAAAAPADSALTEARARLGRRLFFDAQLSRTRLVSCASCHRPENAFSEPQAVSTGVDGRRGVRNAPALVNLAWAQDLFWDGRVSSLEVLAGKPIENPDEMDLALPEAVARLGADPSYQQEFAAAYAGAPTELTLRQALASFVRTLVSGNSPYDRFRRGETSALDAAARRGLEIFSSGKGGCFHCHPAGRLSNDGFFNNGSYVAGGDPGRQIISGRSCDLRKFTVPGLRNVAVSAPYMHDGSLPTLEAVVDQYVRGGRGGPNTDANIAPLSLSDLDKSDLVAFLKSLTDSDFLTDPRHRN